MLLRFVPSGATTKISALPSPIVKGRPPRGTRRTRSPRRRATMRGIVRDRVVAHVPFVGPVRIHHDDVLVASRSDTNAIDSPSGDQTGEGRPPDPR